MRIIHLAAGAANMYCGACARDVAMARALMARGHEIRIVPLYTPLRIEGDETLPVTDVHLGAMNAYLQQISGVFRLLPRALARALDHPALLRWLSRFAVRTDPSRLGPMTVSVLAGEDGRQAAELDRLLTYLQEQGVPDVVTITNSLLSGVAPLIKRRLGCAVTCELKGEDGFVESIPEPERSEVRALICRNAESIDVFTAPASAYADHMASFLDVERDRIAVVRSGIDVSEFRRAGPRPRAPFTIGHLSVITPRKGLHILAEAFAMLAAEGRDVRLQIAGQLLNSRYWRQVKGILRRAGSDRWEYLGEVERDQKIAMLRSLSVFCQPSIKPEALGTAALEAQASGVPVVAPDEGVFPEMLDLTGGGLLFGSRDAGSLAEALRRLMDDPELADSLGNAAAEAVERHHAPDVMAEAMERVLSDAHNRTHGKGDGNGEEAVQAGEEG